MLDIIIFLVLLQIKHWYIDFLNQTDNEIKGKGLYGEWQGIGHSLKHGAASGLVTVIAFGMPYAPMGLAIAVADFLIHYHIDWIKSNFGNKDIANKAFWAHLGLDQMAHQLTYIAFAAMVLL